MKRHNRIHIGTSGWHYDHWIGPFYPKGTKKKDFLNIYQNKLKSAEINNSFYQLPSKETLKSWYSQTSKDFIFSVKASRYITHMKKLKDPRKSTAKFLKILPALKDKLGPVLFQLPPKWRSDPGRLESLLGILPDKNKYAFELRDPVWFNDDIYDILKRHKAAFCVYEIGGRKSPKELTGDFAYVRLHGPGKSAYQGKYSKKALSGWAATFSAWLKKGIKDIYCYFDNDQNGYAAVNATELAEMTREL
jgi:uncharacterized protein YecE (DUF72 family)